jgi:ADP-L-glycero-D-manno-heptose 6-epimerase
MNYKININYIDNPFDFYQNNTQADLTNSFLNLKYTPKYSLEEGIDNYLNEILNYSSVVWKNFLDQ